MCQEIIFFFIVHLSTNATTQEKPVHRNRRRAGTDAQATTHKRKRYTRSLCISHNPARQRANNRQETHALKRLHSSTPHHWTPLSPASTACLKLATLGPLRYTMSHIGDPRFQDGVSNHWSVTRVNKTSPKQPMSDRLCYTVIECDRMRTCKHKHLSDRTYCIKQADTTQWWAMILNRCSG